MIVLAWGHRFGNLDPERAVLEPAGIEVLDATRYPVDDTQMSQVVGLLVGGGAVEPAMLDALPRCRAIVRYGVGLDNIPLKTAREMGIVVDTVEAAPAEVVAEHAIVLALALLRGLAAYRQPQDAGSWTLPVTTPVRSVAGSTLGVLGVGQIGAAVAGKAAALGMRTAGWDIAANQVRAAGMTPLDLDELLAASDVVSLHVPLTETTRNPIGPRELRQLGEHSYLVNTARGNLVHPSALATALRDGTIAGAALDVLPNEPPGAQEAELMDAPNLIVTPHIAWYSTAAGADVQRRAAQRLHAILRPSSRTLPLGPCHDPAVNLQ